MTPALRPASRADDGDAVWAMLRPVFRAGDTYAIDREITRDAALAYWFDPKHSTFLAEVDGAPAGTYYLRANAAGPAGHVANCGYVTDPAQRGRGIARAMAAHSIDTARARGFRAIQFNLVVSTNSRAVALWTGLGWDTVGRLPGAFLHPTLGYVDALVMFRRL